ncbi:Glutathione S-transferase GST-6.0 [Hartmannibacter diazotrophicus]|uniref:Glutathione S-transferase GST-6.0 n=1 Tax=Hartmannibacter diazotrophicus TaxID=1482074 RepID=A0A2C9DBZ0_9HYPH|nr:glutathione S-transferase family protein [Hartmannibacter diazotrophicus]SON57852.1 Glutathione S-transferase GST-6.0 [Hartmannibacter diazotrophicus]
MLTLFHWKDACSLASLITLKEAELEHDVYVVNLPAGDQRKPEFLALNPKGRVPALKTDRGILTETPAILIYLAQLAPDKKLAPFDDPFALATLQSFNAFLCSTVHVAHAHRMRGSRWADEQSSFDDMQRRVPGNIADGCRQIEETMFAGPWVMGETFSVADPYLFVICSWTKVDGVDIADFPKLHDHFRRMSDRPSVQAALAM